MLRYYTFTHSLCYIIYLNSANQQLLCPTEVMYTCVCVRVRRISFATVAYLPQCQPVYKQCNASISNACLLIYSQVNCLPNNTGYSRTDVQSVGDSLKQLSANLFQRLIQLFSAILLVVFCYCTTVFCIFCAFLFENNMQFKYFKYFLPIKFLFLHNSILCKASAPIFVLSGKVGTFN